MRQKRYLDYFLQRSIQEHDNDNQAFLKLTCASIFDIRIPFETRGAPTSVAHIPARSVARDVDALAMGADAHVLFLVCYCILASRVIHSPLYYTRLSGEGVERAIPTVQEIACVRELLNSQDALVDGDVSDRQMLSHLEDGRSWPRVTCQVEMDPREAAQLHAEGEWDIHVPARRRTIRLRLF